MGVDLEPTNYYLGQVLREKYIKCVAVHRLSSSSHPHLVPRASCAAPERAMSVCAAARLTHGLAHRPSTLDQSFVDFDSVRYHLSTPVRKSLLLLSMDVPCWAELQAHGARDVLEREYGQKLLPEAQTEEGYSVSFEIDLEQGPAEGSAFAMCSIWMPSTVR